MQPHTPTQDHAHGSFPVSAGPLVSVDPLVSAGAVVSAGSVISPENHHFASEGPVMSTTPFVPNYPALEPVRAIHPTGSLEQPQFYSDQLVQRGYQHHQPAGHPQYVEYHNFGRPETHIQDNHNSAGSYQQSGSELELLWPNDRAPAARRGPFKDPDIRRQTAETRKIGSCIRCRMQRIRVGYLRIP